MNLCPIRSEHGQSYQFVPGSTTRFACHCLTQFFTPSMTMRHFVNVLFIDIESPLFPELRYETRTERASFRVSAMSGDLAHLSSASLDKSIMRRTGVKDMAWRDNNGWLPGRGETRYRFRLAWRSRRCRYCGKRRYASLVYVRETCGRKVGARFRGRSGWWVRSKLLGTYNFKKNRWRGSPPPQNLRTGLEDPRFDGDVPPRKPRPDCKCPPRWPGYYSAGLDEVSSRTAPALKY